MAAVLSPPVQKFREAENLHVQALRELIQRLKDAPIDSDDTFAELVGAAAEILQYDDKELARSLAVARPTIGRWVRGESSPHPLGRRSVFKALLEMSEGELRRQERLMRIRKVA